jgi:hypothetical protein
MNDWCVGLTGDEFDLEELPKLFSTSKVEIVEDNGSYSLQSRDFDSLTDPHEVRLRAIDLIDRVNGAARLAFPGFKPVSISYVQRQEDEHIEISVWSESSAVSRAKATVVVKSATGAPKEVQSRPLDSWLQLSTNNKSVEKLLRLLSHGALDWDRLHKLLEVVQEGGGASIIGSGDVTKAELGRFTQTANSFGALTYNARHAHEKVPPPPKPMALEEARALILRLARCWLKRIGEQEGEDPRNSPD